MTFDLEMVFGGLLGLWIVFHLGDLAAHHIFKSYFQRKHDRKLDGLNYLPYRLGVLLLALGPVIVELVSSIKALLHTPK